MPESRVCEPRVPEAGAILIVSDDPETATRVRDGLACRGHEVDVATTPVDALMLATLNRPDAVIMDVAAGDAADTRLFAQLQAVDKSLAVILLVGPHNEAQVRGWLKAGAFDWARKPASLETLEPIVRRAVAVGRARADRAVVVAFDPARRRRARPAPSDDRAGGRPCAVCRGGVEAADLNAVLEHGAIFHAACWLRGRALAQQV
jgi:DNA-binding NtrC family response regulator